MKWHPGPEVIKLLGGRHRAADDLHTVGGGVYCTGSAKCVARHSPVAQAVLLAFHGFLLKTIKPTLISYSRFEKDSHKNI